MHRSSKIPKSIRPPRNSLPYAGYPDKHPYNSGYAHPGYIEDSRIAVVLATMAKMICKWPIWLQIKMTRATVSGLSQGLAYGCALGTIVGVEEGYSHTVADMTCTQVELGMLSNVASTVSHVVELGRPEVAAACSFAAMVGGNMADVRDITCKMIDQGCFEQAVSSSYETVLLGVQSGHAHLIAESTINVGREGQTYVEMLAEVVARLVRDGHGRAAARVCLLVIAKGYLKLALRISATMMRRGHIRETAQVSRYLVAAGHTDFKQCLTGENKKEDSCKDSPHPTVCRMARRWSKIVSVAAFIGGVVALHYLPKHREEHHDVKLHKQRQHSLSAKKSQSKSLASHRIDTSDEDSDSDS